MAASAMAGRNSGQRYNLRARPYRQGLEMVPEKVVLEYLATMLNPPSSIPRSHNENNALSEFTLFLKLPVEVQDEIWSYAFALLHKTRVVEIAWTGKHEPYAKTKPVTFSQVNKNTRRAIVTRYGYLALSDPALSKNHITLFHPAYDILYVSDTNRMNGSWAWRLPEILVKWLDSSNIQSFALSHSPKVDYDTLLNSCLVCKDHENIDHVYFTVKGQPVGSSQQAQHVVPAKVADINRFEPARTKKEQKARESNIPAKAANVDRFQSAGTEEEQKARGLSREVLMKRRKKVVKKRQAPYRIVCEHETFSDRRDLILGRLGTTIYTLLL